MNKNYRSKHGQDFWLNENVFKSKKNGFFIEMGALDGVTNSNSYFFEKSLNWKGLLVEPNESSYKLISNHRSCFSMKECVYDGGFVEFLEKSGHSSIVNKSLNNCLIEKDVSLSKKVKSITILDALLKSNTPSFIDYFSLDVEGAEQKIIETFPFEKYLVGAFTIERANDEIYEILSKHKYFFVRKSWPDHYFVCEKKAKEAGLKNIPFSEFDIIKLENGRVVQKLN